MELIRLVVGAEFFAVILCLTGQLKPVLRPDLSDDQHTRSERGNFSEKIRFFWGFSR
jgi:hypothetical protein